MKERQIWTPCAGPNRSTKIATAPCLQAPPKGGATASVGLALDATTRQEPCNTPAKGCNRLQSGHQSSATPRAIPVQPTCAALRLQDRRLDAPKLTSRPRRLYAAPSGAERPEVDHYNGLLALRSGEEADAVNLAVLTGSHLAERTHAGVVQRTAVHRSTRCRWLTRTVANRRCDQRTSVHFLDWTAGTGFPTLDRRSGSSVGRNSLTVAG